MEQEVWAVIMVRGSSVSACKVYGHLADAELQAEDWAKEWGLTAVSRAWFWKNEEGSRRIRILKTQVRQSFTEEA